MMAENSDNTSQRKQKGKGRPFPPGVSGNPGGKPQKAKEIRDLALQSCEKAIRRLVEMLDSTDERVALTAAQALLDRGCGKAVTAETVDREENAELQNMTDAELFELVRKSPEGRAALG